VPFVLPLSRVRKTDAPLVGAKAVNLARLLNNHLPVPDGFCVTTEAWQAHLRQSDLRSLVESRLAGELPLLAEIRQLISEAPLPDAVQREIAEAFSNLATSSQKPEGKSQKPKQAGVSTRLQLAVRSSGTAEDLPGHSFAGLYDTILGEADLERCLALVKRCWASLWTERAFKYRERNHIDHSRAAMAVLVQRLVPADCAGVAFTADPVSGRRDRLVVEAVPGFGDKLVSGQAVPDRFRLDRRNLRVVLRTPAGTAPVLPDRTVRNVARLALRAERPAATPQDVEWAVAGGRVWLLQARPITGLPDFDPADHEVWSSSNTAEVLPGVLTPLVWSTLGDYINRLLGGTFERIGVSLGRHRFVGDVAGRVYTNLSTFTGIVKRMPFASSMGQARMFGGAALTPEHLARLELDPGELPDIKAGAWRTLVRLPGLLVWLSRHGTGRGRRWMSEALARHERAERPDFARFDESGLVALLDKTLQGLLVGDDGLGYALVGMTYTALLYDLCRKWLGDSAGAFAGRLLAGTGELQSAQAGLELWRLGRAVAADERLRTLVLAGHPWLETRAALVSEPAGRDFLARWDRFVVHHGHHARGEMNMFQPRWHEQPDYLLGLVRGYAQSAGHDPEADITRRAADRDRLTREALGRLRNPLKRVLFRYVAEQARRSAAIRENLKDLAIRVLAATRAVIVELGRRLAGRGVLAEADDVFFLRFEELQPAVAGAAGFGARQLVSGRRTEYERNLALNPPAVFVGRYDPKVHVPDTFDPDAQQLTGLAVSPGIVTGPARVVLLADRSVRVLPGEILVAPFTDPGWTPYFIPAAGIVMDQGGLLSHGSIVAREYGIPAVVNVGPATRIVKTGQRVRVDGNRGIVTVLRDGTP